MNIKEDFEKAYEKPGMAIWTSKEPPKELADLIENGKIKPCKVIDIGCGEGFYSIYLAKKGFDVLGIDISEKAIKYAKENAKKENINIRFIAMDIFDLPKLNEKFDFVLEWAIMHHIKFEDRKEYVKIINNILNEKGKYFSTCFNIQSTMFGGAGKKIRKIPENARALLGEEVYFSSLEELNELFNPYFKIIESKLFKKTDGGKTNTLNYLFMEKI